MTNQAARTLPHILLFTVSLLLAAGCGPSAPPTPPGAPEGQSLPAAAGTGSAALPGAEAAPPAPALSPEQEKEVVATLDGVPVTAGRLMRYGSDTVKKSHMGNMGKKGIEGKGPLDYLPSYTNFFAVLRDARAKKVDVSPQVALGLRLHRIVPLSQEYRRRLIETASIPPEQIKKALPTQWTEMNFRLFVFESTEDAQAARAALKPGEVPKEDTKGYSFVAGKAVPETGMVFPGSGFFDAFDDPYLFTLKEGELSRPVQTGVGAALALPFVRKDYTPEEQRAYLNNVRQNLANVYGKGQAEREAAAFPVKIIPGAVAEALREKVPDPAYASSRVVARVGKTGISLPLFFQEGQVNIGFLLNQFPTSQWNTQIESELELWCQDVALGMAAEKAGFKAPIPYQTPEAEEAYKEKLIYQEWARAAWREAKVTVSDEEARAAYGAAKDRFMLPELISIQYYFTPDGKDLEALSKRAEQGISFDLLGRGLERRKASPHGEQQQLEMKERTILKGSQDLQPLQDGMFAMAKGDTQVLEVEMGYYLVHIKDKQIARLRPFEEVRAEIVTRLTQEKRTKVLNDEVRRLGGAVKVRLSGEDIQHKGVPAKPDQG